MVKVKKLKPGPIDPEISFQRYAHDKQLGSSKSKYLTGPGRDNTLAYLEEKVDREKLRKSLKEQPDASE